MGEAWEKQKKTIGKPQEKQRNSIGKTEVTLGLNLSLFLICVCIYIHQEKYSGTHGSSPRGLISKSAYFEVRGQALTVTVAGWQGWLGVG